MGDFFFLQSIFFIPQCIDDPVYLKTERTSASTVKNTQRKLLPWILKSIPISIKSGLMFRNLNQLQFSTKPTPLIKGHPLKSTQHGLSNGPVTKENTYLSWERRWFLMHWVEKWVMRFGITASWMCLDFCPSVRKCLPLHTLPFEDPWQCYLWKNKTSAYRKYFSSFRAFNEFAYRSKEDTRNREFSQFLVTPNITERKREKKRRLLYNFINYSFNNLTYQMAN